MLKDYRKLDPFHDREAQKYPNPAPSREYILECLDEIGKSLSIDQLLSLFGITEPDVEEALRFRLKAMERDGQLIRNRRGKYALVNELELIRGRVVGHKEGFGFLIPDDGSTDLYLAPYQMRSLFPGDIILASVTGTNARGKQEGVVVEVLERNTQQVVGRYYEERHIAFVQPDSKDISIDIVIPPGEQGTAQHGQYVVAEIIAQPTARRQPTGRIVEILGNHLSPGLEIDVAIRAHGLPHHWSQEVSAETKGFSLSIDPETVESRVDLRELPLVTIDGEDAKDFDDAVYCEQKPQGGWRLVVAIADVGHYVKPNTGIDREAYKRGNSVYFPGRVIPMLPEILSNELCSLKPQVDRLCLVCDMRISAAGRLTRYQFYDGIMCSRARLTYRGVTDMLSGIKQSQPALLPHLQALQTLFKTLQKQRAARGALDFDTTETRIVFGKNRKIKEIVAIERTEAHKIIEECMLLANVAAARFLHKHRVPGLYRVHEGPNPEKMGMLQDFLKTVGLRLGGGDDPAPLDYYKLLQRITQRPDKHLIQTLLLRSLLQATYSPKPTGHFGLAYEMYTHFTSPIRRYPDLLVHRAIRHVLSQKSKRGFGYDAKMMQQLGEHCSMTERRADMTTRDAVTWLKCHYMQNKIGKVYEGVITGVTNFGVFLELTGIYVEGLLHISALKNDYYHFDPIRHTLTGKRTRTAYRLGDKLKVLVGRVDLDEKRLDFELP